MTDTHRKCPKCGKTKPSAEFYSNRHIIKWCRECYSPNIIGAARTRWLAKRKRDKEQAAIDGGVYQAVVYGAMPPEIMSPRYKFGHPIGRKLQIRNWSVYGSLACSTIRCQPADNSGWLARIASSWRFDAISLRTVNTSAMFENDSLV